MQVVPDRPIERLSKAVAGHPPRSNPRQSQVRVASHVDPVLVSDGVAPPVEVFKPLLPRVSVGIDRPHGGPELDTKTGEVRAEIAWVRVAAVEFAALGQQDPEYACRNGRLRVGDHEVRSLRVEVSAEALKLRRQQHRVRVIHLERGMSTPAASPAQGSMRRLDLVKRLLTGGVPAFERDRHTETLPEVADISAH